ncbi:MAG: signal peptidase I [Bacteroidota bacterium]|jgi:signal peptidase I
MPEVLPDLNNAVSTNPSPSTGWAERIILRVLAVVVFWFLLRTVGFQGMYIPSDSMIGTLQEGDYILVNKFALGARLPGFENFRLPGYSEVAVNDILVFNLPSEINKSIHNRKPYIKRCIGLPGDTISISDGFVLINGKKIGEPASRIYKFNIQLKSEVFAKQFFGNHKITNYKIVDADTYSITATQQTAQLLSELKEVLSVSQSSTNKLSYETSLFPKDASRKWNSDNYGPLLIPAKGQTVVLDAKHLHEFRTIITEYEGNTLQIKSDSVYINSKYSPTYTFLNNYYFVAGDNRYTSTDSREFGYVPENHIIGRVDLLLYNSAKSQIITLLR